MQSRHRTYFAICYVILLLVGGGTARGESKDDVLAALKDVRTKLEREEKRLSTLQKRRQEMEEKLTSLQQEGEALSSRKQALTQTEVDLEARVRKLELAVDKGKNAVRRQREELNRRIIAAYKMQRRAGAVDYLISSRSATDLMRRLSYLTRIASSDRVRLDKLSGYVADFDREREELQRAKSERAANLESLLTLEKELARKTEEVAALINEMKGEEQSREAALEKLASSAENLEAVLARLMGSEEALPPPLPEEHPAEVTETVKAAPEPAIAPLTPFTGKGLASLKGGLPLPVTGKIVQRFGRQKHEEFADILFVKGLEFNAPAGTTVHAVAAGKIALNQVLPGYGNVVIIDHGSRQYTLYGRLASSLGRLGAEVQAGEKIAILGEPDKKGRNFYFELRVQGKPVNPMEYFKERPAQL